MTKRLPPALFTPLRLRESTLRNRVFVSPMCQYSRADGLPTDWHLVHLGSRAVGGAGLVMAEATARRARGPHLARGRGHLVRRARGGVGAASRASSRSRARCRASSSPTPGARPRPTCPGTAASRSAAAEGGWQTGRAEPAAFDEGYPVPRAIDADEIDASSAPFATPPGARAQAGFEVVEIHMAHGYLLHEFLSPLVEPAHRRVRRDPREPDALAARGGPRGARGVAARSCRCSSASRRPTGWRAAGTSSSPIELARRAEGGRRRPRRLLERRHRPAREDPARRPATRCRSPRRSAREAGIATGAVGLITDARAGRGDRGRRARPTRCCWRASCCATRTGRCTPRRRSAWTSLARPVPAGATDESLAQRAPGDVHGCPARREQKHERPGRFRPGRAYL